MKKLSTIIFLVACAYTMSNCTQNKSTAHAEPDECKEEEKLTPTLVNGFYGTAFDSTEKTTELAAALEEYKKTGKKDFVLSGTIEKICQSKGCWFSMKSGSLSQTIDFDHKFLMHKDKTGIAIAKGYFYNDTTTIEQQIHEAVEDAKSMTEEEAKKKFTTDKIDIGFTATGVKLK